MNHWTGCNTLALAFLVILLQPVTGTKVKEAPRKFIQSKLSSFRPQPLRMCRQRDVCRTALKYRDGTVADEGLLCKCSPEDNANNEAESKKCPPEWTDNDERVLTWQHYERAHWYVQYRFCSKVFNLEHKCDQDFDKDKPGNKEENELAALVETDIKVWQPHVSSPRCSCPGDEHYKLMGWKRENAMWQYFYRCQKPECPAPSETLSGISICAKIYFDAYRKSDMVNEMQFLCNCPKDHLCDAKFDERDIDDVKRIFSDESGKYVIKLCEPIVQKKSN